MQRGASARSWLCAVLAFLALASAPASAGQRALSDFTSRQGAWCAVLDDEGNFDCAASYYAALIASRGVPLLIPPGMERPEDGNVRLYRRPRAVR